MEEKYKVWTKGIIFKGWLAFASEKLKKSWYKWYLDTGYIQYIFYENDQFEGLILVEIANLEYTKEIDDRT